MDEKLTTAATECLMKAFKGGQTFPAHVIQAAVAILELAERKARTEAP